MKIDGSLARNVDFAAGPQENSYESVDFDTAKCESCRAYGKSRKKVSFLTCQKMWSCRFASQAWHFVRFLVCEVQDCREAEVAVPMESCKNVSFSTCHKMCSCRFAWQGWHFVAFHLCEVQDCREAEVAVHMGKIAKTCLFQRVTSRAHVVLRGRRGSL